jgi:hypothetical protein
VRCADDEHVQFWVEGEVFASGELEVDAYVLTYAIASFSEYMIVSMYITIGAATTHIGALAR